MRIKQLDHVNILTDDLPSTVAFYREVLGLNPRDPPAPLDPSLIQWMFDADHHAILHIVTSGTEMHSGENGASGGTGAIDHIGLTCEDAAAWQARLDSIGTEYERMDYPEIPLTQLFMRDPNGVLIELGFAEA